MFWKDEIRTCDTWFRFAKENCCLRDFQPEHKINEKCTIVTAHEHWSPAKRFRSVGHDHPAAAPLETLELLSAPLSPAAVLAQFPGLPSSSQQLIAAISHR